MNVALGQLAKMRRMLEAALLGLPYEVLMDKQKH